jgi:hypothetical protein
MLRSVRWFVIIGSVAFLLFAGWLLLILLMSTP